MVITQVITASNLFILLQTYRNTGALKFYKN